MYAHAYIPISKSQIEILLRIFPDACWITDSLKDVKGSTCFNDINNMCLRSDVCKKCDLFEVTSSGSIIVYEKYVKVEIMDQSTFKVRITYNTSSERIVIYLKNDIFLIYYSSCITATKIPAEYISRLIERMYPEGCFSTHNYNMFSIVVIGDEGKDYFNMLEFLEQLDVKYYIT